MEKFCGDKRAQSKLVKRVHSSCFHGKQKHVCKECQGTGICVHGKQRASCRRCKGSSTWTHSKRNCKHCKHGNTGPVERGEAEDVVLVVYDVNLAEDFVPAVHDVNLAEDLVPVGYDL